VEDPNPSSKPGPAGILVIPALVLALVGLGLLLQFDADRAVLRLVGQHGAGASWLLLSAPLVAVMLAFHWVHHAASHHRELHERREAIHHAEARARQDALTGLLNRRGLFDGVERLAAAARQRDQAVALFVIDLDHFKKVNDIHGHPIGDELLREVCARMCEACPEEALIARIGGDEFAIALEYEPHFPVTVDILAESIITSLSRPIVITDLRLYVGASIGIATTAKSGWEENVLLRQADVAMYRAKQAGRNCHRWFDQSMEAELKRRDEIESELRLAIPRGEIVPFYEPQIDFHTGRVSGVEVLARWNHPLRGLIPPDQFIPIAEETGLIGDLSFKVMEHALIEARDWDQGIRVAVNISPMQLRDPLLAHRLLKLMIATRFPPDRLEVEITESALLGDMATAKAVIASLKNQGVRLALDDFGTGYSSLHHLRALPFDRIKIDRSFVSSILENDESAAIVHAVLGLGESLGIEVTAEGIETGAIAERLKALKCANGQGYFYSRPVPGAAMDDTLDKVRGIAARDGAEPDGARRDGGRRTAT
jgi:diguanylate cyclase (GGDEF)-like protein